MSPADAVAEFRRLVGDRIFGCTFRKADGTLRSGAFRLGVRRDVLGAGQAYRPEERGNVIVWDMRLGVYRTIKLARIVQVRARGAEVNLSDRGCR